MNIVLYSTHCPQCILVEKMLKEKKLDYKEINDINIMSNLGFDRVPVLEVDGVYKTGKEIFEFLKETN